MSYHLSYTAPVLEPWREQAACAGRSAIFFPDGPETSEQEARAKQICGGCPVSEPCLASALRDEGEAPVYARVAVRGGRTPIERGRMAGVVLQREEPDIYDEIDRLLRLRTMLDVEVARTLDIPLKTVYRRRHFLGLPIVRPRNSPQAAFEAGARPVDGGHVEWQTGALVPAVAVDGKSVLVTRLAFQLGYGREPEGQVMRTCDHSRCFAWKHLTDRVMREAQAAA